MNFKVGFECYNLAGNMLKATTNFKLIRTFLNILLLYDTLPSMTLYTEAVYASLSSRIRSILCEIRPSFLGAVKVGFKSLYVVPYLRR